MARRRYNAPSRSRREYGLEVDEYDNEDNDPIVGFKDFDYKRYNVKKQRKADSIIAKAWKKFKKASSSYDLKLICGLLLGAAIILDKSGSTTKILKDMVNGRMDFDTLEDMKNVVGGILNRFSNKDADPKQKRRRR